MRSADDFNRFYATPDPWGISTARFRDRAFARCLKPYVDGKSVLELGCGEGHLTRTALGKAKRVLSVDISDVAIDRARISQPANATFQVSDFMDISFAGFDVVTAIECFYYLSADERASFLRKLVAEHRGRILAISVPIVETIEGRRYFTHSEVMAMLLNLGMKVIEFRNIALRWDSFGKHLAAFAVKIMPGGNLLIDHLPESLIYQRCYIVTV